MYCTEVWVAKLGLSDGKSLEPGTSDFLGRMPCDKTDL